MAHDFTMPKLGLTMTDGTIREWLVVDGSMVNAGDAVLVIETDKVETAVEAREAGILHITGVVGENYACGDVIGQLLGDDEMATPAPAATSSAAEPPVRAQAVAGTAPSSVPAPAAAAPAVASGTTTTARRDDVATRGEGDRILASPRARAAARNSGVALANIAGTGPGGRIVADDVVGHVETLAAAPALALAPATGDNGSAAAIGVGGRILASPMARAAARDRDVELDQVTGTGPGGRIVADDVARHVAARPAASDPDPDPVLDPAAVVAAASGAAADSAALAPAALTPPALVAATGGGRLLAELLGIDLRLVPAASPGARITREDVAAWVRDQLSSISTITPVATANAAPAAVSPQSVPLLQDPSKLVPLRGMRGVIAERMHSSLADMAQLTLSVDANMTAVNAERNRLKLADLPVPGYTAWVIAAAARALVDHPYVNSQVTPEGVAYLPEINLGVAVALDDGLIVPVINKANTCAVAELHITVADLAGRARDGQLKLGELEGGTFSVTALGMYGVDMFTPVINPPNTAILGVGRLRTQTRWDHGLPTPQTVMTLSLTWDHRAFDGAPAAEFAQSIVRYLEDPTKLTG